MRLTLERAMATHTANVSAPTSKGWNIALWIVQGLAATVYIPIGIMKLTRPISDLSQQIAWTADVPEAIVRITGAADLAAGLGLILPALTRIAPGLTVWAAIGATVLQILAIGLHLVREEFGLALVNVVLIAMQLFVIWGRSKKAPIAPRRKLA
jgi:putative oxidoreductase